MPNIALTLAVGEYDHVRDVVDGVGPAPMDLLATLAFSQLDALAARALRHTTTNLAHVRAFLARHPELVLDTPIAATMTGCANSRPRNATDWRSSTQ